MYLNAEPTGFTEAYLLSYPETAVTASKASFKWEREDWTKAAGVVFITGSLYLFDEELSDLVIRNRTDFTKGLAKVGNQFGNGRYVLPALGVTYLSGYLLGSDKTMDTAMLSLKSFLLANGVTSSLKYLTQRQRPISENGKQFWNGKGFSHRRESFPSGHTTIVWSIAPILAEQYKETVWVAPTAYTVACLTSFARIHDSKHWASDVFAGATIGYLTSQLVLRTTPKLQVNLSVNPQIINLSYNF